MIELVDIYKSYGDVEVLRGVDLCIEPHRVTCIVGPSGAGKSTLLQILGTLDKADRGRVLYDGEDVGALTDRRLSRFRNSHIGFVFQMHRLLPEFTLQENVALPAMIGGTPRAQAMDRAADLLRTMGLSDRLTHRPAQLSGGEAQRGAVARALVNRPMVVLADEPSGSLDSHNREELHRLFFELRDTLGTTSVIVTHDESLAADADVTVHIADGTIMSQKRK
ncbi:MAG: ABC transporter ATP-binding protein [Bacteroidales bacterium]|nr:ABC transporter ATP-binding protein [Bacteroidales bacterium]